MWRLFRFVLSFLVLCELFGGVWGPSLGFHETQANTLPTELYPYHRLPILLFKIYLYNFMCMEVSPASVCAPHACSELRGQKRALEPLDLKLQMVMSHRVDARTQTWVFWESSQCS